MDSEMFQKPTLGGLAYACYIYERMSDYDSAYQEFLMAVERRPDLRIGKHRQALLSWLNKWGCRQFAKDYHELASDEIRTWYNEFSPILFQEERSLLEISDGLLVAVGEAYEQLANRPASLRSEDTTVRVGPTGSAKILFALRPQALLPWDDPVRARLKLDGSSRSYLAYLEEVKIILIELSESCQKMGYALNDLPNLIGRPNVSTVKLIDEYFWVTITNNCPVPTAHTLEKWTRWG